MKIGIAGPVSLKMLAPHTNKGDELPEGCLFAPMALWIEELIQRGHEITLFTLAPQISQPKSFFGEHLSIHVGRYRNKGRARDFFKQEQQDLVEAMTKHPVDVLHAHWTYEYALAALKTSYPILITAHDAPLNILNVYRKPYWLIRFLMAWQLCKKAPMLTAVSPYLEKHYRRVFGYNRPIQIIPNGVPEFIFELAATVQRQKRKPQLNFASNLTGWAGRKNGQTLIKAFNSVSQKYPDCRLLMYGNGHGPNEAAQIWAESKGLTNNVVFRGLLPYRELQQELTEKVDVLVHPALEESFSMAIAEAMALGIPVIAGKKSGAVPDTLQNGGLLIDVRSEKDLASAMITLVKDQKLRQTLAENGQKIAERYRMNQMMNQYEALYIKLRDQK